MHHPIILNLNKLGTIMTAQTKLFEFLCELIDIQIKKYVGLATYGVGPDARMNGHLVCEEVNELLQLSKELQEEIDEPSSVRANHFDTILKQVHFYVEQEYLRARAGWLLDDNPIHSPALHRISAQLDELKKIAKSAGIKELPQPSVPQTKIQEQCQHDSNEIAFLILDLAQKVKENPEKEIDSNIVPKHAIQIMQKNATGRYCEETISQEIDKLKEQCERHLQQSPLKKDTIQLSREAATSFQKTHNTHLKKLLANYKEQYPDSKLFKQEHQWYKIGNLREEKPSVFCGRNITLFATAVTVGVFATSMLINFFSQVLDNNSLGKRM